MATLSTKHIQQPVPRWFRKTKAAVSHISDGAIIILLACGYADNSLVMLIVRIGISKGMAALGAFLAEDEVETTNDVPAV